MSRTWDHYARKWDLNQRILELKGAIKFFGEDSPYYVSRIKELEEKEEELKRLKDAES